MRIGIDMLGDQSAGRTRGTGRYTRGLVSRLLENASHEFVLYYHRGLPVAGNALRGVPQVTDDVAPPHDVTARNLFPTKLRAAPPHDGTPQRAFPTEVRELAIDESRSLHGAIDQLARFNPDRLDLLLLTCPLENFQGYLPPFPTRGGPKLAALIYDLIPLVYPEHYLRHPAIARAYRRAIAALRQYDLLLTISESGRNEVLRRLGVSGDRVVNIGAGSDGDWFSPARGDADRQADAACLCALGVREPFLYGLTALDFRKNLAGLLAAVERLPPEVLDRHQIVLSCAASDAEDVCKCRSLIARSAVADRVLLTASVGDTALRALYRRAAAFVFASRYEGFGLPLLEAMQCGAVVVAGDNSSQIEVVGEAGLLADVEDPAALAASITQALTDAAMAERLRNRAPWQAQRYSWQATAGRCLTALEAAVSANRTARWLCVWSARARLAAIERLRRWPSFAPRKIALSGSERQRHAPAQPSDLDVQAIPQPASRARPLAGVTTTE